MGLIKNCVFSTNSLFLSVHEGTVTPRSLSLNITVSVTLHYDDAELLILGSWYQDRSSVLHPFHKDARWNNDYGRLVGDANTVVHS